MIYLSRSLSLFVSASRCVPLQIFFLLQSAIIHTHTCFSLVMCVTRAVVRAVSGGARSGRELSSELFVTHSPAEGREVFRKGLCRRDAGSDVFITHTLFHTPMERWSIKLMCCLFLCMKNPHRELFFYEKDTAPQHGSSQRHSRSHSP